MQKTGVVDVLENLPLPINPTDFYFNARKIEGWKTFTYGYTNFPNRRSTMISTVKRTELLEQLRKNLEKHSKIVAEARDGYLEQARYALEQRIHDLRKGKIVHLQFSLHPPQDYSEVYKNAIAMLEWTQNDTIEMDEREFRQLVRDEWGWTKDFLCSNSLYSKTAAMAFTSMSGGE